MPSTFRKAIADVRLVGTGLAVAAVVLAAASGFSAWTVDAVEKSVSNHVVLIENMSFSPSPLSIRLGDKVEFKNNDIVPHTATSIPEGAFDSGVLKGGETWSFTPVEEGEMQYACSLHPTMKAMISVEKAVGAARAVSESD